LTNALVGCSVHPTHTRVESICMKTINDRWKDVEASLQSAHLIAWDSCHKIYLAMDLEQAVWYEKYYAGQGGERTFHGTPEEMFESGGMSLAVYDSYPLFGQITKTLMLGS
jgi:hypothetical protein